ncbi:MAG: hypothetical protein KDA96_21905, partial [Planctomycetaceae bacterium]|nr:hypothetical protein [Planctomycetaceae bacterium]
MNSPITPFNPLEIVWAAMAIVCWIVCSSGQRRLRPSSTAPSSAPDLLASGPFTSGAFSSRPFASAQVSRDQPGASPASSDQPRSVRSVICGLLFAPRIVSLFGFWYCALQAVSKSMEHSGRWPVWLIALTATVVSEVTAICYQSDTSGLQTLSGRLVRWLLP